MTTTKKNQKFKPNMGAVSSAQMSTTFLAYWYLRSKRRKRIPRSRFDAFSLSDDDFLSLFTLPKSLVRNLCDELREELSGVNIGIGIAVPAEAKVFCALRFYTSGHLQTAIARDFGYSQPSVSHSVHSVTCAINKLLLQKYVSFPYPSKYERLKQHFKEYAQFPGVIGIIDCFQVPLAPLPENAPDYAFMNSKGYHSINTQLICDANMKLINVNARYPGGTEDWFVWHASALRETLIKENSGHEDKPTGWLLGDNKYELEPWLLTPVVKPESAAEQKFNKSLLETLSIIKQCKHLLKSRFKCLGQKFHYAPSFASKIIIACAVLHNICIINKVPFPEDLLEKMEEDDSASNSETDSENSSDENDSEDENQSSCSAFNRTAIELRQQMIICHFTE